MAPVIWGLDLKEVHWSKFKSSYMWNREYHLRRTRFIIYQCALLLPVFSQSLGTAVLTAYIDSQDFVTSQHPGAYTFNNDYVGAASFSIFAGIFNAFVFGPAFFLDLFWPERKESKGVRTAWKACGVLACILIGAAALTLTVITARHCVYFTGISPEEGAATLAQFHKNGGTPVCYRDNGRAVAAVVFAWPGFLSVCASCVLLFMSINHTEFGPGPKSAHARNQDASPIEGQSNTEAEKEKANIRGSVE